METGEAFNCIAHRIALLCRRPTIVYITGVDACGKTHFASGLASHLSAMGHEIQLIHVDDFHRPKSMRYMTRKDPADAYYESSFDIGKLVTHILQPARNIGRVSESLLLLNLASDRYELNRRYVINSNTVVIVEGVFLARPEFRPYCDLLIYLDVSYAECLRRAKLRDVPTQGQTVIDKYAAKYFRAQIRFSRWCKPKCIADIVIDNNDPHNPSIVGRKPTDRNVAFDGSGSTVYKAVVFDLWNTLIPLSEDIREHALRATSDALGIKYDSLLRIWRNARCARETMDFGEFLKSFCVENQLPFTLEIADAVRRARYETFGAAIMRPRDDAEVVLRILRASGFKTAVLSNCTSEVRDLLSASPLAKLFDVTVLSCEHGQMKPNPEIFRHVANTLSVETHQCMFIGDGSDCELPGAETAGMTAVMLEAGTKAEWSGLRIRSLEELLPILVD